VTQVGEQYLRFISKENFILAYQRIKTMPVSHYKSFYRADFRCFELYFDMNIEQLISEVTENIYEPSNCEKYYTPKKRNLARPMTLLTLPDLIVYQALSNIIADSFHPHMMRYFNKNTFGNIFIKSDAENSFFFFERWKKQWQRFNNQKMEAFNQGYEYSMEFDIASFYDTIDHQVLFCVLKTHGIEEELLLLLEKCFKAWTTSSIQRLCFTKNCGIPQGPVSSALFSEIYLFLLDEEMRRQDSIKYFRYADDINIMAKTFEECQKMVVYLDLLARELALIPQSEKIMITHIHDIKTHINNVSSKFSGIAKEFRKNDKKLSDKTHNKLKKQFMKCFEDRDYNKTIIKFALFKLNKDDDVKYVLIQNIKELELFYKGIIYYFNKFYPNDIDFEKHIVNYLLGETVLFQYNKSLLFKYYEHLGFNNEIFQNNYKERKPFWIVLYQLVNWLERCKRHSLAIESYSGDNYYISQKINYLKAASISDGVAKEVFIKSLISSENPMISLQGIFLWDMYMPFNPLPDVEGVNGYSKKILQGVKSDYFTHFFEKLYNLTPSNQFMQLIMANADVYKEIKESLMRFLGSRNSNPSNSLMNLDLLHNVLFDVIGKNKGYTTDDFGGGLEQLRAEFPATLYSFDKVHQMRNQKTDAHYKDKFGNLRTRISKQEYEDLLSEALLFDAYKEIFDYYSKI